MVADTGERPEMCLACGMQGGAPELPCPLLGSLADCIEEAGLAPSIAWPIPNLESGKFRLPNVKVAALAAWAPAGLFDIWEVDLPKAKGC